MFLFPLTPKGWTRRRKAVHLYRRILAQSRLPFFYESFGVADTLDGRFDLLSLHATLVVDRLLKAEDQPEGFKLAQALFDEMFLNLEFAVREIGIGDLAVPRHVKRMMEAFHGRASAYRAALQVIEDDSDLKAVLLRNLYAVSGHPNGTALSELTSYVRKSVVSLADLSVGELVRSETIFPCVKKEISYVPQECAA
jgi:cytochrome b pre-mRNA-processing protein 3